MCMGSQTSRLIRLTTHKMLTGRPMPVPYLRGPYDGPPLEQLDKELMSYVQHLSCIPKVIFQQVKGATEEKEAAIPDPLQRVRPEGADDPAGTAKADRRETQPGSEKGDGDTAQQEARRSQSPQGERRSQRLDTNNEQPKSS